MWGYCLALCSVGTDDGRSPLQAFGLKLQDGVVVRSSVRLIATVSAKSKSFLLKSSCSLLLKGGVSGRRHYSIAKKPADGRGASTGTPLLTWRSSKLNCSREVCHGACVPFGNAHAY